MKPGSKNFGLSKSAEVRRQSSQIGTNIAANEKGAWKIAQERVAGKRVTIIGIRYFPSIKSDQWKGFLTRAKKAISMADSLIIDMRGNSGGDDQMAYHFAHAIWGQVFPTPFAALKRYRSPTNYAFLANEIMLEMHALRAKKLPISENLISDYFEQIENIRKSKRGELPGAIFQYDKPGAFDMNADISGFQFDPNKGFKGKIFVLYDRQNGSSGEIFVDLFEYHPNVIRVGQNSIGTLHFGNARPLVLPYSKITVYISQMHKRYKDGRFIERKGIPPNVRVPTDKDGIHFIFEKIIRK